MRTIAILIGTFLPCALLSQVTGDYTGTLRAMDKESSSTTIGNPYVFEDFLNGYIYFSDKTRSTERMINYNCYDNEVLYLDGENMYLLDVALIDSLEFRMDENTSLIFRKVELDGNGRPVFLNILYDGESALYKRYYKEFRESDAGKAYGGGQRYDEYIDRSDYYISLGGEDIQPLSPRKNAVLKMMGASAEEMESFLKNEKINLKSDDDLVRMMGYYDSLATRSQ